MDIRVERDKRIRERNRDSIGSQQSEVSFSISLSGLANTGLQMFPTDALRFNMAFYPKQGERKAMPPVVRSGFNIELTDPKLDPINALGLTGIANVYSWIRNDDGMYIGARAHIGVVHLGVIEEAVGYKGYCSLSFAGLALQEPYEVSDYEFRPERPRR